AGVLPTQSVGSAVTVASTWPLNVAVGAMPDSVQAGQRVTYSITLSNPLSTSPGFALRASVPNGPTVGSSPAGGGACSSGTWPCMPGEAIVWGTLVLSAGETVTLQFSASVGTGTAIGTVLTTAVTTGIAGQAAGAAVVGGAGPQLSVSSRQQVGGSE